MGFVHWLLAAALTAHSVSCTATSIRSFENTNVQRTIELGGSLTHVTTTYTVRALGAPGPNVYTLALSELDQSRAALFEVNLKGSKEELQLHKLGFDPKSNAHLYSVELPPMTGEATATIVVNSVLSHASTPFPASVKQGDPQLLTFSTDAYVLSPYRTLSERTKVRTPSPKVLSYSAPAELQKYAGTTTDSVTTRSGAVITYGPFENLPATTGPSFQREEQKLLTIHYEYDSAVVTVVSLDRSAEISHWGSNLNIQDNVHIRNDGPSLKGHFSRLELQQSRYFNKPSPQVLTHLTLQLPAGIHTPYYYDSVGNVTTSRFRAAAKPKSSTGRSSAASSFLEIRPRYPLLGGWNYTYTLGWDAPLGDSATYDKSTGKYVVGIPFMTAIPGAAVDQASMTVVFPEGAENVEVQAPFDVHTVSNYTHVTYLDTIGRPAVRLNSSSLTDQHTGIVFVTYTLPLRAHLAKPLAVTTAMLGFFLLAMLFRRVDWSIGSAKAAKAR